jgi:hypothetical protein
MTELNWNNFEDRYDLFEDEDEAEEALDALCKSSTPSDFFFHVGADPDAGTIVSICPKSYFEESGYMYDGHLNLSHILPKDFADEMECVWSCERSVDDVKKDMLSRGFEKSEDFDDLFDGS